MTALDCCSAHGTAQISNVHSQGQEGQEVNVLRTLKQYFKSHYSYYYTMVFARPLNEEMNLLSS